MEKFKTEKNDWMPYGSKSYLRQDGRKSQLDWIRRQLEYADFSEKYQLRYDLRRGEIYEIDWGINVNAEFSNRHFGVVLVDSDEYNPLVTVCPLKSNHSGINPKSDVDLGYIPELGTRNTTIAVVNQVRTIDKLRIYMKRVIGRDLTSSLSENNDIRNQDVLRLKEDKFELIIKGYKNYISNLLP